MSISINGKFSLIMEHFLAEVRQNEDRLRMSYEDEIGTIHRNLRIETKKKNYLLKRMRSSESGGDASAGEGEKKDNKDALSTTTYKKQKKYDTNIVKSSNISNENNNNTNIKKTIIRGDGLIDIDGIILCETIAKERAPAQRYPSISKIKPNKPEMTIRNASSSSNKESRTGEKKFIETVRGRDARDALPGFACSECENFYEAMVQQGIIEPNELTEHLRECSRHKARWKPPTTPDGFWDLTVRTPEDWK